MKLTKSMVVLATLLAVVLLGAVLPASQQSQAQTPSITMVGLPDLDPMSGRFINVTRGTASLGDTVAAQQILNVSLEISPALSEFALWIFDGDMGGGENYGYWDTWGLPTGPGGQAVPFDDVEFVLYRDPQVVGNMNPADQLAVWSGLVMPDDDWFKTTVNQDAGAFNAARGAYYYHLVCNWLTTDYANEQNNFKIAIQGRPFLRAGSTIGFEGFTFKIPPDGYDSSGIPVPRTKYDGTFTFYFNLPENGGQLQSIELWDGDADFVDDTNDANSPEQPPFPTSPYTYNEGANPGDPEDDYPWVGLCVPPDVRYTVIAPNSAWSVTNDDPSGNQEWERYCIALNNNGETPPDIVVSSLPTGAYQWQFYGLDGMNTVFIYVEYDLYPDNPPPPPPPPGTGTPGYWKNHPEAWPVDTITIGGVTYTKEQAIKIMKTNKAKDKTYTMFNALVCAKLNLILGNESSCIALTVLAADNWMKTYGPVGSGVKASSQAWKQGEPLYLELDKYNNGLLCAPHRD